MRCFLLNLLFNRQLLFIFSVVLSFRWCNFFLSFLVIFLAWLVMAAVCCVIHLIITCCRISFWTATKINYRSQCDCVITLTTSCLLVALFILHFDRVLGFLLSWLRGWNRYGGWFTIWTFTDWLFLLVSGCWNSSTLLLTIWLPFVFPNILFLFVLSFFVILIRINHWIFVMGWSVTVHQFIHNWQSKVILY